MTWLVFRQLTDRLGARVSRLSDRPTARVRADRLDARVRGLTDRLDARVRR